jgi:hypothetical protein
MQIMNLNLTLIFQFRRNLNNGKIKKELQHVKPSRFTHGKQDFLFRTLFYVKLIF